MKKLTLVALAAMVALGASHLPLAAQNPNTAAWEKQAQNITIIRDNWGIAHVYGKTDADAVFGVVYAQAEDDFNRVETNFINGLGRLAEAEGEKEIYRDLRMKLYEDPEDLRAKYQSSPAWLKTLMNAWADGLNYYLATHPKVTPRVIKRFEPWMALSFSEGSIGGDIERINLQQLEAFYGGKKADTQDRGAAPPGPSDDMLFEQRQYEEPTGSNGAAIAPSNTVNKHSLLLINPHTSFFFRSEAQMVSEEGIDAYGAITWGQFFIYQGFNDRAGWMHTSSGVDNIDEYLETVTKKGDGYVYKYGGEDRPVVAKKIVVPYKTAAGMAKKEFTVYRTHHGPVVRELDGKWVSVRMMQDEVKALTQSYSRTKAKSYKAYRDSMELHTNSSNNTIYADADGNIAYFHSNFIPRRNPTYDWTRPVDGSTRATEWDNILSIDETPGLFNPKNGWLYNVNNWPWSAAGPDNSPKRTDFPPYVDRGTAESPRGVHALRVFSNKKDFTLDGLIAAAYDSYLPSFAVLVPPLVKAWDAAPDSNPLKAKLQEPIAMLRVWDFRWSATSVPTSLGQYYGEEIGRRVGGGGRGGGGGAPADDIVAQRATADQMLQALAAACDRLTSDFGTWRTPWGDINRYQRNNGDIAQVFDDKKASVPVAFTSSRWGSLASFGARTYPGTKKMYGTSGNSFVAVVEFGDRVRAKAVSAGGEGGDPASPHFADQAVRYANGNLRDVYFYREDVEKHAERTYHPGK